MARLVARIASTSVRTRIFRRKALQVPDRCSSTWRSVSARNPRFHRSPSAPAIAPMANAPAYQSGIQQAGAAAELVHPLRAPGEMVLLLPRARSSAGARADRVRSAPALIERLGAHFADVVHAHERRACLRSCSLSSASGSGGGGRKPGSVPQRC
jgi:hypothetical protein